MEVVEILSQLANPKEIIRIGGLAILIIIIFIESGLFFGFFLPGDSLVFTAGLLCGTSLLDSSLLILLLSLNAAGILGYFTGYFFGENMGKKLLKQKENIFFKRKYIDITAGFYKEHGSKAFLIGRFLPVIRTFVPILAGLSKVNYQRFMIYNILGCVLWICPLVLSGFYLGKQFPQILGQLEWIVLGFIMVSTIPVIGTYLKEKSKSKIKQVKI